MKPEGSGSQNQAHMPRDGPAVKACVSGPEIRVTPLLSRNESFTLH